MAKPTQNGIAPDVLDRDFAAFAACMQTLNISRAAELLGMQQAGLSKRIMGLEDRLGRKLFLRRATGLVPTEFGRDLNESILLTKRTWQSSFNAFLDKDKTVAGRLRLGAHGSIGSSLFPRLLPHLEQTFPDLNVEVELARSPEVTKMVADFAIDLGFVINPVKNSELIAKKIAEEYVAVWSAKGGAASTAALYNPEMYLAPSVLKKYVKKARAAKMTAVSDYDVIASVIKRSNYRGFLPSSVAERHGLRRESEPLLRVDLCMIWHKRRFEGSSKAKVFESITRELQRREA